MASGKLCDVCHDDIEIYAVGQCDHPICFKCSTRMRLLCEQMYCAICRADLPQIYYLKQPKKYDDCKARYKLKKDTIYFENEKIQAAFYTLTGHKCKFCSFMKPLRTFRELEQHMRREHNVHYCEICVKHLKIFTHERKVYDRETLARHKRIGDADDKSHKGHPLCELCDQRYLDRDILFSHCRKDHFYCHFCETDGRPLEFFDEYRMLKEHFGQQHFLCEEGECYYVQHTNAFRSEIDLKAHRATEHSRSMKKSEARQARTIEVDFNLAPRHAPISGNYGRSGGGRGGRGRGRNREREGGYYDRSSDPRPEDRERDEEEDRRQRRQRREELQTAQAVAQHLNHIHKASGSVAMVDRSLVDPVSLDQVHQEMTGGSNENYERHTEDFPTLGGSKKQEDSAGKRNERSTLAKKVAHANNFSVQDGSMEQSDFPSLGGKGKKGKGKTKANGNNQSAWKGQPNVADFPELPTRAPRPKPAIYKPPPSKPVVEKWAQPAASVVATSTKPSLSSIGNSLLGVEPKAPGLSLTRSSTWAGSGAGHGQPMEKQQTQPKPNFAKEDFPTLGGSGSVDNLRGGGPAPAPMLTVKSAGRGRGARKQPAPMPDFMSSYSEPEPTKPAPKKEEQWEKTTKKSSKEEKKPKKEEKQQKKEDKQPKKEEKQVDSKKKKNKGKNSGEDSSPRNSPDIDGKDSKKTKMDVKTYRVDPPADTDVKTYKVDPPKQTQNSNKDSPKNSRNDAKKKLVDSPKASKKSMDSPKVPKKTEKVEAVIPKPVEIEPALQTKTNNFPSLSELSETSSIIQSLSMNDFPALNSDRKSGSKSSKAPPGFQKSESVSKAPPGFSAPSAKPPPPGFAPPPVDNIENVAPGFSNGTTKPHTYSQPANFKSRNQQLIVDINQMLSSMEFEQFKASSGRFRQGMLSAAEYYTNCCDIMGRAKFGSIFPELLSLLPDIGKQQELLRAQSRDKSDIVRIGGSRGWKTSSPFTTCGTCRQVVLNSDLTEHTNTHSGDVEFPTLGSISASLGSWPKK